MVQKTSFVVKLHAILEDPAYTHVIRWAASGQSFLVLDSVALSAQVLPRVFKHNNYTVCPYPFPFFLGLQSQLTSSIQSFVRQLNLYGFHKKNRSYHRSGPNDADDKAASQHEPREFSHPQFLRYRPDLEIRRKPTASQLQNVMHQRRESSAVIAGSQSPTDRVPSEHPALSSPPPNMSPSSSSSPARYHPYATSSIRQRTASRHGSEEAVTSRSSRSVSPPAGQAPPSSSSSSAASAAQLQQMNDMQGQMMKQISNLQYELHHLSRQLREFSDRNDTLERQMEDMRRAHPFPTPYGSIRPSSSSSSTDGARPPMIGRQGSPALPFTSDRSSPSMLPPPSSTTHASLPPPAALASFAPSSSSSMASIPSQSMDGQTRFDPFRHSSARRHDDRDHHMRSLALPPLRSVQKDGPGNWQERHGRPAFPMNI
ncbi:hypothetical protein HKX48_000968 [Thoreauomyces humboldtii]|nr:hypothetical protein HKX48_000968 [Thoreauomyces humboldtii]